MKKELLVASALAGTMGLAGVAEAATASFSGNVRAGVTGDDVDSTTTATHSADQKSSLSFSVSETTDAGTKISTSFSVHDEGVDDAGNPAGITLTFTDDSTLKLIEAGNGDILPDKKTLLGIQVLEELMSKKERLTYQELAKEINCNDEHARRICIKLFTEGKIERQQIKGSYGRPFYRYYFD